MFTETQLEAYSAMLIGSNTGCKFMGILISQGDTLIIMSPRCYHALIALAMRFSTDRPSDIS